MSHTLLSTAADSGHLSNPADSADRVSWVEIAARGLAASPAATYDPVLEVEVPVHNEEKNLEPCIEELTERLAALPFSAQTTIVDNASTDRSWEVARRWAQTHPGVRALRPPEKGRGRALRAAWSTSPAGVFVHRR